MFKSFQILFTTVRIRDSFYPLGGRWWDSFANLPDFTESGWSEVATAATVDSTLTFGIDSASLTFTNLSPSNSYTDSSKTTVLTTSTNASPTTWSGTGFGYSTNDSDLSGGTANRFTTGGPKYAGFGTGGPGDPVAEFGLP